MTAIAMKEIVPRVGRLILGRRNFARFARLLWLRSRLDVPNEFCRNGERSFQTAFFAASHHQSKVVVFDVGANVGAWAAPLAGDFLRAHELGRLELHLFEPAPDSAATLRQNMRSFDAGNVIFNCEAVAERSGVESFYVMGENAGTNALYSDGSDDVESVIEVECITLDDYCRKLGVETIDLLKIDAEGGDLGVLRGAQSLLWNRAIRFVQFEYNHRWVFSRAFLRDVFEMVEPCGYKVGKLTREGVERYRSWHPELESFREGNYLIWRDSLPGPGSELEWWNA